MVVAGNVAGAAGTDPMLARGIGHRFDHRRMPAHAEIIVGAPHDDVARLAAALIPAGVGKPGGVPFEFREYPVAPFSPEALDRLRRSNAGNSFPNPSSDPGGGVAHPGGRTLGLLRSSQSNASNHLTT